METSSRTIRRFSKLGVDDVALVGGNNACWAGIHHVVDIDGLQLAGVASSPDFVRKCD
ncbi:MAG: hypothetical protein JWR21_4024 [Herminiimonas sp.]|nr:hypothetical protein [Herminiimonas sp.]